MATRKYKYTRRKKMRRRRSRRMRGGEENERAVRIQASKVSGPPLDPRKERGVYQPAPVATNYPPLRPPSTDEGRKQLVSTYDGGM
jgi:hypothetical protein